MAERKVAARADFTIDLGPGLKLSARRMWVENLLITANSGGGKSVAGRQLIEQCASHCAMVVFDYKGEYWSLREAFDVILVGRKGELPIDVAIAPELASFVRKNGCRVVVNLSGVNEETKQEFVAAFCNALINLPDELHVIPLLMYISEAQMLAPEEGRPVSRKAIRDLATLGRQQRICTVMDTQRLAELAKAAIGSLTNRMFGRQTSDVDLARATGALGLAGRNAKSVADQMRRFDPGWFFCEGGAFSVRGNTHEQRVPARTSAHTKTRQVDPADDFDLVPPPASASISKLVSALASRAAEIKSSASAEGAEIDVLRKRLRELEGGDELRRLRARVTELERGAVTPAAAPSTTARGRGSMSGGSTVDRRAAQQQADAAVQQAVAALLDPLIAQIAAALVTHGEINEAQRALDDARTTLTTKVKAIGVQLTKMQAAVGRQAKNRPRVAPVAAGRSMRVVSDAAQQTTASETSTSKRRRNSSKGSDSEIRMVGWRRVLAVLNQYGPRSRSDIGVLAVMVANVGSFGNMLRNNRDKGYIVQVGDGTWAITKRGTEEIGDERLPMGRDLIAAWRRKFGEGAPGKMFDAYADAGAAGLTRSELGAKTHLVHNVGSFGNAMRAIKSQQILVEIAHGRRAFVPLLLEHITKARRATRKSA